MKQPFGYIDTQNPINMPEVPRELIEAHFADLEIVREIKGGAHKQVYEAEYDGEHVAFKVVPIDNPRQEEYVQREIESMERIDSPHIPDLIDHTSTEIDDIPVIVIVEEFCPGETLEQKLESDGGDLSLGIDVTLTTLNTLPELEEFDTIHRDIKPGNIIIGPDNSVKLIDLGVARLQNRTSLTPSFAPFAPGTLQYSAPEQLNNEKDIQDHRTDQFPTGIVMFETITGEHPFAPDDASIQIPDAILEGERKDLEGYIDDPVFESELNEFYKKLTSPEPYQRFKNAMRALDKFDEIISDADV